MAYLVSSHSSGMLHLSSVNWHIELWKVWWVKVLCTDSIMIYLSTVKHIRKKTIVLQPASMQSFPVVHKIWFHLLLQWCHSIASRFIWMSEWYTWLVDCVHFGQVSVSSLRQSTADVVCFTWAAACHWWLRTWPKLCTVYSEEVSQWSSSHSLASQPSAVTTCCWASTFVSVQWPFVCQVHSTLSIMMQYCASSI